jgi:hypothetical protein
LTCGVGQSDSVPTFQRQIQAQTQIWQQQVFAPKGKLQPPGAAVS